MRQLFLILILLGAIDSTKALNAEGAPLQRIAFGSCYRQGAKTDIWSVIGKTDPDLFLFLGDTVYADTEDPDLMRKTYNVLGTDEGFRRFRRSVPVHAVWDDHDYGINDGGADFPAREMSREIFLDFFEQSADSPRRTRRGIYESYYYGKPSNRVQIILLDTRFNRSPHKKTGIIEKLFHRKPVNVSPEATMLGEEQWTWLRGELEQPAVFRIIASSIQVLARDHRFESWSRFPLERAKLLRTIRDAKAEGVVFLSGDRHFAEVIKMREKGLYPLYDFTSSGMTHSYESALSTNETGRIAGYSGKNFGVLEFLWKTDPAVRFLIKDESGNTVDTKTILRSELGFSE